jgi:hypothetical protein
MARQPKHPNHCTESSKASTDAAQHVPPCRSRPHPHPHPSRHLRRTRSPLRPRAADLAAPRRPHHPGLLPRDHRRHHRHRPQGPARPQPLQIRLHHQRRRQAPTHPQLRRVRRRNHRARPRLTHTPLRHPHQLRGRTRLRPRQHHPHRRAALPTGSPSRHALPGNQRLRRPHAARNRARRLLALRQRNPHAPGFHHRPLRHPRRRGPGAHRHRHHRRLLHHRPPYHRRPQPDRRLRRRHQGPQEPPLVYPRHARLPPPRRRLRLGHLHLLQRSRYTASVRSRPAATASPCSPAQEAPNTAST